MMVDLVQCIQQVIIVTEGTVWIGWIASCIAATFVLACRFFFSVENECHGDFPTLHPNEPAQGEVQNDH